MARLGETGRWQRRRRLSPRRCRYDERHVAGIGHPARGGFAHQSLSTRKSGKDRGGGGGEGTARCCTRASNRGSGTSTQARTPPTAREAREQGDPRQSGSVLAHRSDRGRHTQSRRPRCHCSGHHCGHHCWVASWCGGLPPCGGWPGSRGASTSSMVSSGGGGSRKSAAALAGTPPPAARRFPSPWRGRSPPHPCLSSTPGRIPSNPPRGQETAELGLPLPLRATGCEPCRLEPNDQVLAARHPVNRLVHVRPRPAVARVEKCIVRGGRQPVGHKPIRPKRRPRVPTVPAG